MSLQCVLLETPSSGNENSTIYEKYAKACLRDSLLRNEAPFSAYLLYKQPGIISEDSSIEKTRSIEAELSWSKVCSKVVVYNDYGISYDMKKNIENALKEKDHIVEYRSLGDPFFKPTRIRSQSVPPPIVSSPVKPPYDGPTIFK